MKPVAWVRNLTDPQPHCVTDLKYMSAADTDAGVQYVPLYAELQPDLAAVGEVGVWGQRQWKWLTEEEIDKIANSASSKLSAIFLTESQLHGKNAL